MGEGPKISSGKKCQNIPTPSTNKNTKFQKKEKLNFAQQSNAQSMFNMNCPLILGLKEMKSQSP